MDRGGGHEPEFGARPLRQVIQRELADRVANLLVTHEPATGGTVKVTVEESGPLVSAGLEAALAS